MEKQKIFIVGKYFSGEGLLDIVWSLEGTFLDEQKAIEACHEETHFVMEALFNDIDYDDKIGKAWYPLRESKKKGLERVDGYQKSFDKDADTPMKDQS